jgi:hypothetical protein
VGDRSRRSFLSLLALGAVGALGSHAKAGTSPVALGEVRVPKPDAVLKREFRRLVVRELGRLDLEGVRSDDRYVLSAALVQMTTEEDDGQAESTAVVSATLRRERGGTLHAMLEGRARAVDGPHRAKSAEHNAMRAAVRVALTRVPEALK